MSKPTDIRVIGASLWFLPVQTRVPLKFGAETLTHVTCARVRVTVESRAGRRAVGWGETPLSVQWVWPSRQAYEPRFDAIKSFCRQLVSSFDHHERPGHPMEVGQHMIEGLLADMIRGAEPVNGEAFPLLAGLVCYSAFDIATHDAFGNLVQRPVYETYNLDFMNEDLSAWLGPAPGSSLSFHDRFPADYFASPAPSSLPAWHLVGGLDLLDDSERTGDEPDDGYPVTLVEWIRRDGLKCLKVKLRGTDAAWDYERLVRVGQIAIDNGADWLTTDFNCTVTDPTYVNAILDRLMREHSRIHGMVLYVEQPFLYDLEAHRIDVHSVSARKPLFMDESAHDWLHVRLGRELGWTGVALKTCKTQTGALLSMCWAKAHGMTLMVQDLTNPMLAQVPHVLLAAHAGTIMGVETNAMQFYPDASSAEAMVHPGLYQRRHGVVDLSTLRGPGFGYRVDEIERELSEPVATWEA